MNYHYYMIFLIKSKFLLHGPKGKWVVTNVGELFWFLKVSIIVMNAIMINVYIVINLIRIQYNCHSTIGQTKISI